MLNDVRMRQFLPYIQNTNVNMYKTHYIYMMYMHTDTMYTHTYIHTKCIMESLENIVWDSSKMSSVLFS